ncbi:hypothetical protein J2810_003339 [Chryseobacterium rhizosphaerae]|uniref:hypothetical protein n=1 Tax=Chryseobacterium rhizosphaerae TaxID=395937 RepID=UPI002857BD56|nr:hypothetical protein [Chryseobacterium rhizosphaerae]MDR6547268.1 hypothetical protein [Chryseobacterium rhizosphaerae]
MKDDRFNFTDFIESIGFRKSNDQTYIYRISDNQELYLHINRGDYIIPVSSDIRFRKEIPKKKEQAEKQFKVIGEVLKTSFEK